MKKLSPILLNRIIVALSLAIFLVGAMDYWFFTVEDAYISFRYCDHMLQGRGLVFNPGEPVEGYTNFLWIMTIALTRLAVPFPLAAKLPGFIFGMALILMLGRWRMDTKTYSCAGPLAALLTAACPGVQMWAVAGLETILFSLCITAGFLSAARTTLSARMISGLLFGLATLTRPEGILFFGVFLVVELVPFPGRKQAIGAAVAGFCLVVIPHQIFRVIYY
ncbi:hypothetical protein JXA80_05470, partial [bacterium]|nr:hypothetical protein [candidate division CSSED10-310 bacterium]